MKSDLTAFRSQSVLAPLFCKNLGSQYVFLSQKYFKPSEASPLTQKKQNFMLVADGSSSDPLQRESEVDNDRENPSSPFVTFGKTPPKVFKSKRLQIFGNKPDIALVMLSSA